MSLEKKSVLGEVVGLIPTPRNKVDKLATLVSAAALAALTIIPGEKKQEIGKAAIEILAKPVAGLNGAHMDYMNELASTPPE